MVNVYVFRDDATTPTGWSEIAAGYRDRLVLLGGTVLETGGTTSHSHTVAVSAIAQSSLYSGSSYGAYGSPWRSAKTHQHVNAGTVNCSSYGHMPAYKAFRVVYRSTTDWDGSIPSGSILFRESVPAGWSRTCDGESYFLLTSATAGSYATWTGHNHSLSGQTNNDNGTAQYTSETNQRIPDGNHYHTFAGQLANDYHDYKYWSCGLIKASSDVFIQRDSYALFDGDPGTNWEAVSADGNYLRISSTNSVAIGGSYTSWTHNHGGSAQITSNQPNTGGCHNISSTSGTLWNACAHTHVVTITVQNQTVQPSYVRLLLYKSLTDFGNPTTYTVTYDLDVLVAKLNVDSAADADIVLKKQDIPATLDIDALLEKLDISTSADFDILSQLRDLSAIYATDDVLKRIADTLLDMSSRIVLRIDEEVGVDALLKQIYSRELIFDLITKKPFESQADFDLQTRDTIPKTFTLDALLKKLSLSTGLDVDTLLRKLGIGATYQMDMLGKLLDQESACTLDTEIKTARTFTELADLLVSKAFAETYEVDTELKVIQDLLHTIDVLTRKALSQSMTADLLSRKAFANTYGIDIEIEIALEALETVDLLLRAVFSKTMSVDFINKLVSEEAYASDIVTRAAKDIQILADLLSKKSFNDSFPADVVLKEINSVLCDLDSLIKRLDVEKTYASDIEIKVIKDLAIVADIITQGSLLKGVSADLVTKRISEVPYASDMVAKAINQVQITADLLSKKSIDQEVSVDTIIREISSVLYGIDALIQRFDIETVYDTDIEIKIIRILAGTVDLLVKKSLGQDLPVNLLLEKLGIVLTYQIGLLCKRLDSPVAYDLDIQIRTIKEISEAIDLLVEKGFSHELPVDLLLKKFGIDLNYQMDVLSKRLDLEKTYSADLDVLITKNLLGIADLLIRDTFSETYSHDMISKIIQSSPYALDAEILIIKDISEAIDFLLEKPFSQDLALDLLLKKLSIAISYQMDGICKSIQEKSYPTDAQVMVIRDLLSTADLLVSKTFGEGFPSDMLSKKLGITVAHQMDLLGKRLDIDDPYAANVEIKIARDYQLLADLLIKRAFGLDLACDLIMQKGSSIPYQMDFLAFGIEDVSAELDMWLITMFTQTYNTDFHSRIYNAVEWEMGRKLRKDNVDFVYYFSGYFKLDAGTRIAILIDALCFGDAEYSLSTDLVLSEHPTIHRPLRRYPRTDEVPAGSLERHKESFEYTRLDKTPRLYPEADPAPANPEVHSESFDYESSERRNRPIKKTYR